MLYASINIHEVSDVKIKEKDFITFTVKEIKITTEDKQEVTISLFSNKESINND